MVRIKEDDEWKTAFRTQYGIYEYQIILFGLTNAPTICQTLINDTLAEYLDIYTVTYLNDILIYSENLEDHQEYIKNVLKRLLARQLRYKSEKYKFYKKEMDFLRFIIGTNGIKIDPKKIQKILDWPESRNLKNLQEFLGFRNFNRWFISRYLFIIFPLTKLTKKDILFIWTTSYKKVFNKLKKTFITISYLILFVLDKSIRIEINILDKDIGVYLFQ